MVTLEDPRLKDIAPRSAVGNDVWPEQIAKGAILRMFPHALSVEQLCQALGWVKERQRSVGDVELAAAAPDQECRI
jgi:hypothetical protein